MLKYIASVASLIERPHAYMKHHEYTLSWRKLVEPYQTWYCYYIWSLYNTIFDVLCFIKLYARDKRIGYRWTSTMINYVWHWWRHIDWSTRWSEDIKLKLTIFYLCSLTNSADLNYVFINTICIFDYNLEFMKCWFLGCELMTVPI